MVRCAGHLSVALDARQAEDVAVELDGRGERVGRNGDEVDAGDEWAGGGHRRYLLGVVALRRRGRSPHRILGVAGRLPCETTARRKVIARLMKAGARAAPRAMQARRHAVPEAGVEFGSRVAMQNSHADNDDQLHPLREVPRWTWPGDDGG